MPKDEPPIVTEYTEGYYADAEKPARRVYRSVKVTKHSIIPHVRYRYRLVVA